MARVLRVVVLSLLAGCGAQRSLAPRPAPPPRAPAASQPVAASRPAAPLPPPPTEVQAFAAAHGGLHARPVRLPYRDWRDPGEEAWLFFVGGELAQAAWVFTPKTRRFERVEGWPRAIRVAGTLVPRRSEVTVLVESVAARGQPGGLLGAAEVENDIGGGGVMRVTSWHYLPALQIFQQRSAAALRSLLSRPRSQLDDGQRSALRAALTRAQSSPAALAAALSSRGAAIWQVWQGRFGRTGRRLSARELQSWKLSGGWLDTARAALEDRYCFHQLCLNEAGDPAGIGLSLEGGSWKIDALVEPAPSRRPAPEVALAGATPTAIQAVARFHSEVTEWEVVEELRFGEQRSLGLLRTRERPGDLFLAERDGAWTDLTELPAPWPPGARLSRRFVDLDGDGKLDLVLHAAFEAYRPPDVATPSHWARRGTTAIALLRSSGVDGAPREPGVDVSLAMAAPPDLEAAIQAARSQLQERRRIDPVEACNLVLRGAGRRFRGVSAPGAQVILFSEPHQPHRADRVMPAGRAGRRDLERLGCCPAGTSDCEEEAVSCRGAVCGTFDYALGSFYQFTWIRGQLRLLKAAIYVGS